MSGFARRRSPGHSERASGALSPRRINADPISLQGDPNDAQEMWRTSLDTGNPASGGICDFCQWAVVTWTSLIAMMTIAKIM